MSRTLAIVAALVVLSPWAAQAATSRASNRFTVETSYEKSVAWYEAHRVAVFNSANCRVLQDRGNGEYKVQTNTPLGACLYYVKETHSQGTTREGRNRTTYVVKFVRNVSGRLAGQELTITITDLGGKVDIAMSMITSVAGRFVPVFAVRNVQEGCLSGCERYIKQNAR